MPVNSIPWRDNLHNPLCRPLALAIRLLYYIPEEHEAAKVFFESEYKTPSIEHPMDPKEVQRTLMLLENVETKEVQRTLMLLENVETKEPKIQKTILRGMKSLPFTQYIARSTNAQLKKCLQGGLTTQYYNIRHHVKDNSLHENLMDGYRAFIEACGLTPPRGGAANAKSEAEVLEMLSAFKAEFARNLKSTLDPVDPTPKLSPWQMDKEAMPCIPHGSLADLIDNGQVKSRAGCHLTHSTKRNRSYDIKGIEPESAKYVLLTIFRERMNAKKVQTEDIATISVEPETFWMFAPDGTENEYLMVHRIDDSKSKYPSIAGYGELVVLSRLGDTITMNETLPGYVGTVRANNHMVCLYQLTPELKKILDDAPIKVSFERKATNGARPADLVIPGGTLTYKLDKRVRSYTYVVTPVVLDTAVVPATEPTTTSHRPTRTR